MAYVRAKKVLGRGLSGKIYTYYQLVEGHRDADSGLVRQRVLKHLGPFDSIESAREAAAAYKQRAYRQRKSTA
jgi:hypothetical protein